MGFAPAMLLAKPPVLQLPGLGTGMTLQRRWLPSWEMYSCIQTRDGSYLGDGVGSIPTRMLQLSEKPHGSPPLTPSWYPHLPDGCTPLSSGGIPCWSSCWCRHTVRSFVIQASLWYFSRIPQTWIACRQSAVNTLANETLKSTLGRSAVKVKLYCLHVSVRDCMKLNRTAKLWFLNVKKKKTVLISLLHEYPCHPCPVLACSQWGRGVAARAAPVSLQITLSKGTSGEQTP